MDGLEFFEEEGDGLVRKGGLVFDLSARESSILPAGGIQIAPAEVAREDEPTYADCKQSNGSRSSVDVGSHVIEQRQNADSACVADTDDPPTYGVAKEDGVSEGVGGSEDAGGTWTKRVMIGDVGEDKAGDRPKISALEASFRAYVEKKTGSLANPAIGTSFDSLEEAYDFYNLYSWEIGFGVCYAKSRLNVHRQKCMQEIVCGCAGKPLQANSRSTRCGCGAMIRLLRSDDKGWYVCEHKSEHNHELSLKCEEKSHRHIDRYTRELVKQLRDNNVSIGKVYSIIGGFFGTVKDVPFTKRSLKTLCARIKRDQSDNDATKTIEVFNAMRAVL